MAAVQLEDLPVVVKFLLHSVSASDAYEVRVLDNVHTIMLLKTLMYLYCLVIIVFILWNKIWGMSLLVGGV